MTDTIPTAPSRAADPSAAAEVFYDGACPICRREIAAYKGMDGMDGIDWRDVSDEAFAEPGLDREAALARFHARTSEGEIVSGAKAFLAVWKRSPKLAPLARLLDRPPFVGVLEIGYRGFLRVRPLWRKA